MDSLKNPDERRPPTDEEKEREPRVYMVVRADLALSRADLARVAAQATWGALKAARATSKERFARYDTSAQPKIALRARSLAHLERALAEALAADLPTTLIEAAPKLPAAVGIGPVARFELPDFVRKLQMLPDTPNEAGIPVPPALDPPSGPRLWLLVRADAAIPFGKLASQSGHGCWAALKASLRDAPDLVAAWDAAGAPVSPLSVPDLTAMQAAFSAARRARLSAAFIVDAGRTVFGAPTATVVGVGPCEESALPDVLRGLSPIEG